MPMPRIVQDPVHKQQFYAWSCNFLYLWMAGTRCEGTRRAPSKVWGRRCESEKWSTQVSILGFAGYSETSFAQDGMPGDSALLNKGRKEEEGRGGFWLHSSLEMPQEKRSHIDQSSNRKMGTIGGKHWGMAWQITFPFLSEGMLYHPFARTTPLPFHCGRKCPAFPRGMLPPLFLGLLAKSRGCDVCVRGNVCSTHARHAFFVPTPREAPQATQNQPRPHQTTSEQSSVHSMDAPPSARSVWFIQKKK